jgi:chromosome segregation ATPase
VSGDKLRSELASTKAGLEQALATRTAELEAERQKLQQLEQSTEGLRLSQGAFQQQLAKQQTALEQSEQSAAEMRRRLQQVNATYLASGDKQRAELASTKASLEQALAAKAAELEVERQKLRELQSSTEAVRLGSTQHSIARQQHLLLEAEEESVEMKRRLQQVNATTMATGGC